MGDFLGSFLARTVLPTVAKIAPKVVAPLATGALRGLASTEVSKIFGNRLIFPVATAKQQELFNKAGPYLTNTQISQMLKSNELKLIKKRQGGGFSPLLLCALGSLAAPVLGSLYGKGLKVIGQQRPYGRVPRGKGLKVDAQQRRVKKWINFRNKPISNFDIMNWVKELKIKHFDGVFNKDSHQWAFNCGIINVDSNNGPGTHWACYVDSSYFDPFGLPPPESILFIKRYNTLQYQKRYPFFVVTFVFFFFIKKFQDGNSIYDILYKILVPTNPRKNETILKDYFINYGNV